MRDGRSGKEQEQFRSEAIGEDAAGGEEYINVYW
jgi:hypothetical protein